jgi:protein-disulfide isomerase
MRRLPLLALLLLVPLTVAYAMSPAEPATTPEKKAVAATVMADRVLGDKNAKVTLIEYASLSCSHCADFANKILPALEEKYIKTGKVKLIYRDFPLDAVAMRGAQLARCLPEDRYFPFIKTLFSTQTVWLAAPKPEDNVDQYAKLAGMSSESIAACVGDAAAASAIMKGRMDAVKKYDVHATPTFVVNDGAAKIEGAKTIEDFDKVLSKYVK